MTFVLVSLFHQNMHRIKKQQKAHARAAWPAQQLAQYTVHSRELRSSSQHYGHYYIGDDRACLVLAGRL